MADVGDIVPLTLTVDPADNTTSVSAEARRPDDSTVTLAATPSQDGQIWTAYLPITILGAYRITWTVTGTGEGVETDTVYALGGPDPAAGESYATLADLADRVGGDPPANAGQLLVRASRLVDTLLIGAWYAVDDDGLPAGSADARALRDATVAQAEWMDETGDSTGAGALYQSATIGNVQFTRGYTGAGSVTGVSQRYAPDAINALRLAGLLPMYADVVG